ncbi:MAG TPA: hypothetical protein VFK10_04980 [Burkholderiaceae bacterium]|nr:hypothetical protein [Burkholderiaceae bacterium]
MRTAPPFELDVTPTRGQRAALAVIGALCAAALSAWAWSHIAAAAGPVGVSLLPWLGATAAGALLGAVLGWAGAPGSPGTLAWQQGQWTLRRPSTDPCAGTVQARLDAGSWMLLRFDPDHGGAPRWLGVSARVAGPAWHALRATLFAPGVSEPPRGSRGDARS